MPNPLWMIYPSFKHQTFYIIGSACYAIVMELLGPTLDAVVADYSTLQDRLEPEIILKITKQLLQAVASLHKARYAHGGKTNLCT
jgi:hypothetical protein